MARPTKYSDERAQAILAGIEAGLTLEGAAAGADISRETVRRWCRDKVAFRVMVGTSTGRAEARFTTVFVRAASPREVVERRTTTGPDGTITTVETVRHDPGDWRAALEWLKRRRYADWGDRKRIDVTDLSDAQILSLLESTVGDDAERG